MKSSVKSAERTIAVLEFLGTQTRPAPTMVISRECVIPKSSTHHLLNVLLASGFVAYHRDHRGWTLGARVTELGGPAPTIGQALAVLSAFDRRSPELTAAEVSHRSRVSLATVAPVLETLRRHGLLTGEDGTYALGLAVVALAARVEPIERIRRSAHPHLVELQATSGETANLLVREGDHALYIDQVESRHVLRSAGWSGRTIPLEGTAAGAALSGAAGVQVMSDTVEEGVTAIAGAIETGARIDAAISIIGPSSRLAGGRLEQGKRALEAAVAAIRSNLRSGER